MIRTLIVDDHPAVRQGLVDLLRDEPGITPIGAVGDSASALELVGKERPRCVIVDRQLGPEDGLELISRLCALPNAPDIVLYSASVDAGIDMAAVAAGAGATVDKTGPVDDVIAAVKRVCSESAR